MAAPLISTRDIHKIYGSGSAATEVLKGISLDISPGEFVAIMGPSGSGKSTLMHILGLLDRPTVGTYQLAGEQVDRLTEDQLANLRNQKLGFVFQAFNLLARTSALDNVTLPLAYSRDLSYQQREQRATAALAAVGLAHRLFNLPSQLSGGEQQRVAIARALVNDPQIIFADEPTGNLDTKSSLEIMAILQQLNQQGRTVVVVTHEPHVAQFARRVINLRDGLIISDEVQS